MKNNEKLADLIGNCDDKFIELSKAEVTPVAKRRISFMPFVAAAACVCLLGGGIYIYSRANDIKGGEASAPNSEGDVLESQSALYNSEIGTMEGAEIAPEQQSVAPLDVWNALSGYWYNAEGRYCNIITQDDMNEYSECNFETAFLENSTAEDKTAYYTVSSEIWDETIHIYTKGYLHELEFSGETELTATLHQFYSFLPQSTYNLMKFTVVIDYSQYNDSGIIKITFDDKDFGEFVYAGKTAEEADSNYVNGTIGEPDIYEIPQWDEMEIYQQFPWITHNGVEYTAAGKSEGLTQDDIGGFLGTAFSQNTDDYTDITYENEFEYYEINSIDSDYAVAVYFPELSDYHVYTNCQYETPTLGDLVSGLNLEEHMRFDALYLDTNDGMTASHCAVDLSNNDTSVIWDFLRSCADAESMGDYIEFSDSVFRENSDILDSHLDFAVYSDVLGFGNLSFSFTKGGYITTNITSTGRAFYIGIDKVNELVNLLSEQGIALGENSTLAITIPPVDDTNEGTGESEGSGSMTLGYNPPTENTDVYLIAEVAQLMGKTPVLLSQDEAASILQKIATLSLTEISDVDSIDFPTGGGYLINIEGDREQSFNIIGEDILCIDGEHYYSIESDVSELIDEIVGLLGAQDAESTSTASATGIYQLEPLRTIIDFPESVYYFD